MTQVRLYAAMSLDGFVADSDGDSTWMEAHHKSIFGESEFLDAIGAVVLGRRTCQMIQAFGEWPYSEQYALILSSQPPWPVPATAVIIPNGIRAAVQAARERTSKDVWIVGGAVTMQSALEAGLVDIVEICVAPYLIGSGLSLLNSLNELQKLEFDGIHAFSDGVVKLRYEVL